jgi:CxxC motif-containing protein (DUF1111 family)
VWLSDVRRLRSTSVGLVCALGACTAAPAVDPSEVRSGGATTVFDRSVEAYTQPAPNLTYDQMADFSVGNSFNSDDWVIAPSSTVGRDGLGPVYNATGCSACHSRDGRGQPPAEGDEMLSMLVRLSVPGEDEHGGPLPEPTYGGQLQPRGILGVPGEGSTRTTWEDVPGAYADGSAYSLRRPHVEITSLAFGPFAEGTMMSVRVAPPQYGLGLLEAITEADLLANADPDDLDHDGISGRPNHVWDPASARTVVGRFGWKANQPDLVQQTAGALLGDIGITTSVDPVENCGPSQSACMSAPNGGAPEASDSVLAMLVFYGRTLAVPARRGANDPTVLRGRALFRDAGCADCHVPTFTTGDHEVAAIAHQRIWPYTDLLLHDMGEDLADHRPDHEASGTEWRTPPLWGIGLLQTVNRHQFLLHDGRARGFAEAILWHGGEGEAAREAFRAMSGADRDALLAFLGSL